jgi:DNA repair exonuclease SbcCD ATPase subunit
LNTLASELLEDHAKFKKSSEEKNDKILKLEDEKK